MQTKIYNHITHKSIPIFIDKESEILILGSLPSVASREVGFYYGHKQNRFFKVLSAAFDEDECLSIEDRKDFLKRHKIALYDVIEECDIIGSSDSSIKNPVVINIKEIINNYPNIKVIALNGGKAKSLFDKYLLKEVDNTNIKIYYLPSTSPANARMGMNELTKEYKKIFIQ